MTLQPARPWVAVPQSSAAAVDRAVAAGAAAYPEWRSTPPGDRIQYLVKFKVVLEETQEVSRTITTENAQNPS